MSQSYNDMNAPYRQPGYAQPYSYPSAQQALNPQGFQGARPLTGPGQGTYGGQPIMQPMMYPPPTPMPQGALPTAGGIPGAPGTFQPQPPGPQVAGMPPTEPSLIENILRLNKGKLVTVFTTYEGKNSEGLARTFKGVIEAAGNDHLVLNDPQTGQRYLIPMTFFAYAVFDEELEYEFPGLPSSLSSYPPPQR